jgi:hypothetical protein
VDRTIKVSAETALTIKNKFDNQIYTIDTTAFGTYEEVLSDAPSSVKLIILILDIKDSYNGVDKKGFVAGYFDPKDLLPSQYEYANGAPILYIDADPNKLTSELTYSTIAHEFQHLINFCNSVEYRLVNGSLSLMDTWIDEGLSTAAEYLYGGHDTSSSSRIAHFNRDPLGTITKGNNFFIWGEDRPEGSDTTLDDYATAYLFFQWLRLQSGGGDNIYTSIAQSSYADHNAVTRAAAIHFDSTDRNQYNSWPKLLGTWHQANYSSSPNGRLGYRLDTSVIKPRVWAVAGGNYALYPGGAVYSRSSNPKPGDAEDIHYLSAVRGAEAINNDKYPYSDTNRIIMFNVITDVYTNNVFDPASIKTGSIPGSGETKPNASISARSAFSAPYPIDVRMARGEQPRRINFNGGEKLPLKSFGRESED